MLTPSDLAGNLGKHTVFPHYFTASQSKTTGVKKQFFYSGNVHSFHQSKTGLRGKRTVFILCTTSQRETRDVKKQLFYTGSVRSFYKSKTGFYGKHCLFLHCCTANQRETTGVKKQLFYSWKRAQFLPKYCLPYIGTS